MPGLAKRDLQVLAETAQEYVVWIKRDEKGVWLMEIHLSSRGQVMVFEVETFRREAKRWRLLSDAILFAQDCCKNFKDIYIEIGEWVLTQRKRE